jgi:hypothetical protein
MELLLVRIQNGLRYSKSLFTPRAGISKFVARVHLLVLQVCICIFNVTECRRPYEDTWRKLPTNVPPRNGR